MVKKRGRIPDQDVVWLELPVGPGVNEKYVNRNFVVSKKWRDYKERVGLICLSHGLKPTKEEVEVKVRWYRSKSQISHKSDSDSREKALYDALEGWVYEKDHQIRKHTVVMDDSDPHNPRMVVNVVPWRGE